MSWKYSSYTPRDLPSSREAPHVKFGVGTSKVSGDRWPSSISAEPRLYRNPIEPVEHSPLWAKTRVGENPATVQRLRERYKVSEEPGREVKPYKKAETKELGGTKSGRSYGRSLTTLSLTEPAHDGTRFRRAPERAPEPERTRGGLPSPLEGRKLLYMPTATTKLLSRKYSGDLSPASPNAVGREGLGRSEQGSGGEDTMTVVTRGTSPTPTTSSVYLRSKRVDFGLEKKVCRARRRVETAHKEVQTERESSLSKYGGAQWSGYGGGGCYGSRLGVRSGCGYESRLGVGEGKRASSREELESSSTSDLLHKSVTMKPPASGKSPPTSPVKDSEKRILGGKSPPTSIRPSLTSECAKSESERKPNSPTQLSSPLQCKMIKAEAVSKQTGALSPKVTIERCPDIARTVEDVSSASESSEEETSSEEEPEEPVPPALAVKKSVTNFLQNIPNQSRSNVCQKGSLSPQWGTFQKAESGHLLSPPFLVNRQFSRDKDWLKGSWEDVSRASGNLSPKDSVFACGQGVANGEGLAKGQRSSSRGSATEFGDEVLNGNVGERRRNYSKSPENLLSEDLGAQMKFNQQSGEYLTKFQRECSAKDLSQKVQNGLGSPQVEEMSLLDAGDMSGMISKAKAGLAKSKTKLDIKRSSSRETSPMTTDTKSEIDLYWRELADSLTRPLKLCDLDFTDLDSDHEADLLANTNLHGQVPPPPPMLFLPVPTPPLNPTHALPKFKAPAPPPVPHLLKNKKTVKLFWKEVKDEHLLQHGLPQRATLIWDELPKVCVDAQKLEYLFESRAKDLLSKKQQDQNKNKEVIVLDPKRSNAINIGMTKLPPPRAIKTAILKMDATVVNKEGIDKLLTMLPTDEEKLRIQEAHTANPDTPLGSAEQFLITLASITELEARLRLWAFKLNFENNEKEICEPLMDLKQGIEILRTNTTFQGILATLLSVGNFLNGYDVKGFQIDYLSKVPEVKDTVHKHSLLHHLCLIVMDKFPDSTDLYSEIGPVTRASKVDFDELAANIKKVEEECKLSWNYLKMIAKHEGHTAMKVKMSDFLADCAERIIVVGTVHKRIMSRFHKFAFWLGVPMNRISTTRPNEIFKTISEFALEYRTTRDRVLQQIKKINREKTRTKGHLFPDHSDMLHTRINSKEAKDDARLKQLLRDETTYSENTNTTPTWRRQRRDTRNLLPETNNNDEEILDALIKTANQVPSQRLKERRRSRIYGKYSTEGIQTGFWGRGCRSTYKGRPKKCLFCKRQKL